MTSFWEILKSSKNLKASDAFAELWGKSIADSWDIITITGALPLTFEAKGEALTDYHIYGTENGAGVETENEFDITNVTQVSVPELGNRYGVTYSIAGEYTIKTYGNKSNYLYAYQYNENDEQVAFAWIVQNPTAMQRTFTLNNGDILYLVAAIESTTHEQAITLFKNWLPVVCKGATAPASYIPPGYQLPLTLTSGQNTDTYPLYIGDTKLGTEEYVDYQEQKVWKYGANVYDKDDSSMHYGAGYAIDNEVTQWKEYDGNGHTWRVPCSPNTKYRISIPNAASIFKVATARTGDVPTVIPTKPVNVYGLFVASEAISEYVYITDSRALYIVMQFSASEATAITENLLVQAFQPTNPPAPFPAITAYKGENTLSSTETVGEVSVTGKIKEI